MGPRSTEGKAARKFADSISVLGDFNVDAFAYLFTTEEATEVQERGMSVFLACVQYWANKEIRPEMTPAMINLIVKANRILDGLATYGS